MPMEVIVCNRIKIESQSNQTMAFFVPARFSGVEHITLPDLPLDIVSDAAFGYGLRRLHSGYTGAAIRVRRSSDNAEQDIGFTGNDLDIVSLLSFIGSNSGFVKTRYDQSGQRLDSTQQTNGNQARIINAGVLDTVNGKPALWFSGDSWYTADASFGTIRQYTACVVTKIDPSCKNYARILTAHNGNDPNDYATANSIQLIACSDNVNPLKACVNHNGTGIIYDTKISDELLQFSSQHDSANMLYFRTDAIARGNATTAMDATPMRVISGAGGKGGNTIDTPFTGYLAEELFWTSYFDCWNIEQNQKAYWGIA